MNMNIGRTILAAVITMSGLGASTLADSLSLSAGGVQRGAYEVVSDNEAGAIRAAFLQDAPLPARQPGRLSESLGTLTNQGQLRGGIGEVAEVNQCSAVSYDVMPESAQGLLSNGCDTCGGCSSCDVCQVSDSCEGPGSVYYAEVQVMWLRAHVMEDAIGKLSETYQWSPRLVAGFENANGIGARGRWWHYGHATPILGSSDELDFNFDVIDGEITARFAMKKADLVVSGGARWANVDVEIDGNSIGLSGPGLTAAADVRVELCGSCNSQWAAIGGARFSTIGGDWEGDSGFVQPVRDDNIIVQELYIGTEYTYLTRNGHNLFARLTFEVQNWHSDAAAQMAGTDSIGFVGPGVHAGASF